MLKKITTEEALEDRSTAELDALKHRDWVRRNGRGLAGKRTCVWRMQMCVLFRHGCGCSWWRSCGREWSWRRCRSSRSTLCPRSSASRRLRCWCRTSEPTSSSYAKSWWGINLLSDVGTDTKIWKVSFNCEKFKQVSVIKEIEEAGCQRAAGLGEYQKTIALLKQGVFI